MFHKKAILLLNCFMNKQSFKLFYKIAMLGIDKIATQIESNDSSHNKSNNRQTVSSVQRGTTDDQLGGRDAL